jgi:hypothetical protein
MGNDKTLRAVNVCTEEIEKLKEKIKELEEKRRLLYLKSLEETMKKNNVSFADVIDSISSNKENKESEKTIRKEQNNHFRNS